MALGLKKIFVPFGELRPDLKQFGGDIGTLTDARNVVPIHGGGYTPARTWQSRDGQLLPPGDPRGFHVHPTNGDSWRGYTGFAQPASDLYQISPATTPWTITVKTRLLGGPYAAPGAYGWQGASFGDAIVMTNETDDPQLLVSPATLNFAKLAQSGGGNPGMDPRCKFVFPIRSNFFLANLTLLAGFDTLPIGANPTVVCWSQSENIRQYGSFKVTPQLTQSGYQPLNYDLGHITGGIGGTFGIVALQQGYVRIDGPPYVFRPIVRGTGCYFPNSLCRLDEDIYSWGTAGPMVLRGGEGPAESLIRGRMGRTLLDDVSGYSPTYAAATNELWRIAATADVVNRLIWFSYTSLVGPMLLVYSVEDGRLAFVQPMDFSVTPELATVLFPKSYPTTPGEDWAPGMGLVAPVTLVTLPVATFSTPYFGDASAFLLERAFHQLEPEATTRIHRLRPIFSVTAPAVPVTISATVTSKNRPYDAGVSSTSSTVDTHGRITFSDTKKADFHQILFNFGATAANVQELRGFEVWYEVGPETSA